MKIALRALANGKYVCAESQGDQALIANRDAIGQWETFDVIVLEGAFPTPPDPTPPVGPPPSQTAAYVAAVKAQLTAQGEDLSGPCGAFKITKNVAWGLRLQGLGLLSKPGGNNCEGYSTDVVMYRSGVYVDILGDGGNANTPQWSVATDTIDPDRWREPVQP